MQGAIDTALALEVVEKVEAKTGHHFTPEEVAMTVEHTVRKCELNGKDIDYFYILLATELRDFLMRAAINRVGLENYERQTALAQAANE